MSEMYFLLDTCYPKQIFKSFHRLSGPLEWIISNLTVLACQGQWFMAANWFIMEIHVITKSNEHILILLMFTINHSKSKIRKFRWFHTKPATSWAHANTDTVQLSLRGLTWCLRGEKKRHSPYEKKQKCSFMSHHSSCTWCLKNKLTFFSRS